MQIRSTNWKILTFTIVPFLQNSPDQYLHNPSLLLFGLPSFFIVVSIIKKKLRCFLTLGSTSWVNTVHYSQAYNARNSLIDHTSRQ